MSIILGPRVQDQIRHWVERGRYPDADAVVEQALRLLADHERARFLKVRELVLAGRDSGCERELSPVLWEEIARDADEADRLGLPVRREVEP